MIQTVNPVFRQRNLIFHENWESPAKVLLNGGTITGTPLVTKGKFTGNGTTTLLQYNGTTTKSLERTAALTIVIKDLFMNCDPATNTVAVLSTYNDISDGILLWTFSGRIDFWTGVVVVSAGGYTIPTGTKFKSLAIVYDGSQPDNATRLKMYADGVQQTLGFNFGAIPASLPAFDNELVVGGLKNGSRKWIGEIGTIQIYNVALTSDEIKSLYDNSWSLSVSGK